MELKKNKAFLIPAEKIEETDSAVIVTHGRKKTIVNNAAILSEYTETECIAYAKLTSTKYCVIVEPIFSDEMPDFTIYNSLASTAGVSNFTIEEFIDIYLNNVEVRTEITNGKYTFYRNNLIPESWMTLNNQILESVLKKIEKAPILSKSVIDDKIIYQFDDFANRISIFTGENIDEMVCNYSFSKKDTDTVGTFLNDLMRQKGIINARLFDMTGIDKSTISEYLNDNRNQQKNYLIAICVALRLLPKQSTYLLSLADVSLGKNTEENMLYQLFLDSCAFNEEITVAKCNEILIIKGFAPLTNLRVVK